MKLKKKISKSVSTENIVITIKAFSIVQLRNNTKFEEKNRSKTVVVFL